MTEMVYGSMPARVQEPVLPRWWRTIDKWTLTSILILFGIGMLLGLAASMPPVFAQVDGDPVAARCLDNTHRPHRIRVIAAARIADRGDMIDVDA